MFYAERNNLINSTTIMLTLSKLREYFLDVYRYFYDKGYFKVAFDGVYIEERWNERNQVMSPLLAPSPEVFFLKHLKSECVYPIFEHCECYTEVQLFTVIEILYDKIGYYDYNKGEFVAEEPRQEFLEHINSILKIYDDGYMLEKANGFIMKIPNKSVINLLNQDISFIEDNTIIGQLEKAMEMYYKYTATAEDKKSAIVILSGILEPLREELKQIFGTDLGINRNIHDKLIFEIV
ncbi:MAG: hypothetical protein KIA08_12325, partial [Clostridium baratii]|uniref:hypothetical protein n=1 Tax=Clostridium baratii TaxID=1561 RepID=UPI0024307CE5